MYLCIDENQIKAYSKRSFKNSIYINADDKTFDINEWKVVNGKAVHITDKSELNQIKANILNQQRLIEIQTELNNIDIKKIRAITEPSIKDSKTGETWLEYYNTQANSLREELESIEKETNYGKVSNI